MDIATDQAVIDAEVAAMVAASPNILTPAKSGEVVKLDQVQPADPAERLRLALSRRAAFRAALGRLRPYRADTAPVVEAIQRGDADDVRLALCAHATGAYLDSELGRGPDTFLGGLNHAIEQEVVAAVYASPSSAATIEDGPDGRYVRQLAEQAMTPDEHLVDLMGRPTRAKTPQLSQMATNLPR